MADTFTTIDTAADLLGAFAAAGLNVDACLAANAAPSASIAGINGNSVSYFDRFGNLTTHAAGSRIRFTPGHYGGRIVNSIGSSGAYLVGTDGSLTRTY